MDGTSMERILLVVAAVISASTATTFNLDTSASEFDLSWGGHACAGWSLRLQCDGDMTLALREAWWGPGRCTSTNSTCAPVSVLGRLAPLCDGRSVCDAPDLSAAELGDPCPGEGEYTLTLSWVCKMRVRRVTSCENRPVTLTCPGGTVMRVKEAVYGRAGLEVCNPGAETDLNTTCREDVGRKVWSLCDGHSSCTVTPLTSYLGDPCPGTYKYLEATYVCAECSNRYEDASKCVEWAEAGECYRNPAWMGLNCRQACWGCGDEKTACLDGDARCEKWASEGECENNPGYMLTVCRHSCQTCHLIDYSDCGDRAGAACRGWAEAGECQANPRWMTLNCNQACGYCSPDSPIPEPQPPMSNSTEFDTAWAGCADEGWAADLGCEGAGRTIAVTEATWGTATHTCGGELLPARAVCAASVRAAVAARCDGLATCRINATVAGLGADPCPGLGKSLRVQYTCQEPVYRGSACENVMTRFECPDDKVMRLVSAAFGRTSRSVCNPAGEDLATCVSADTTPGRVWGLCDATQVCDVTPRVEYLGDPCPGTYKHMDLAYVCGECVNALGDDTQCSQWEAKGECRSNAGWMALNCRKACWGCGGDKASCADTLPGECAGWAAQGECFLNPGFILPRCRHSCRVCHLIDPEDCRDREPADCASWADQGECSKNPYWMTINCPVSCNACYSA